MQFVFCTFFRKSLETNFGWEHILINFCLTRFSFRWIINDFPIPLINTSYSMGLMKGTYHFKFDVLDEWHLPRHTRYAWWMALTTSFLMSLINDTYHSILDGLHAGDLPLHTRWAWWRARTSLTGSWRCGRRAAIECPPPPSGPMCLSPGEPSALDAGLATCPTHKYLSSGLAACPTHKYLSSGLVAYPTHKYLSSGLVSGPSSRNKMVTLHQHNTNILEI